MGKGEIAIVLAALGAAAVGVYLLATGKIKLPKLSLPSLALPTVSLPTLPPTEILPTTKIAVGLQVFPQLPLVAPKGEPSITDFLFGEPFQPPIRTEPTVTVAPVGTVPLFPPEITGEPVRARLTSEIVEITGVPQKKWRVALINGQPIGVPI